MELKKRHFIEYCLFLGVSVLFLVLFIVFSNNRNLLKLVSGLISSMYVLWGIIHSASEGRLTPAIVFEYLLFGILAFLLLFIALSFA
jgi:Zn-dependent protease with chaperone function